MWKCHVVLTGVFKMEGDILSVFKLVGPHVP
jgi:hypothetical protein